MISFLLFVIKGELVTMYSSLPFMVKSGMYSIRLPNALNFGFDFHLFTIVLMLSYIPSKKSFSLSFLSKNSVKFAQDWNSRLTLMMIGMMMMMTTNATATGDDELEKRDNDDE